MVVVLGLQRWSGGWSIGVPQINIMCACPVAGRVGNRLHLIDRQRPRPRTHTFIDEFITEGLPARNL